MDKLVYLFELDSVHTSPQEILRGQQALFEETVLNGNQVVLTFNQLTDSQAFLCAIRDPDSYPHMLELFRLGTLKISRFAPPGINDMPEPEAIRGQVERCRSDYPGLFQKGVLKSYPPLPPGAPQRVLRTASHYIQNAVEKCLNDDNDSFLFSALPFRSRDKTILAALSYALQYSDPSVLDTCSFLFSEDGPEGEAKARERRDYVKRYVEMILQLSREPLAANPEKTEPPVKFGDMLERIFQVCQDLPPQEAGNEAAALLPQALELLDQLRKSAFGPGPGLHNRSNWYALLHQRGSEPHIKLAEAVVDLCYHYTMEASISGVARHYWDDASFREDFLCRLRLYWADGQTGVHQFPKQDSRDLSAPVSIKLPPWDAAVRLLKDAPAREGNRSELYGAADARERRVWYWRIGRSLLKQFGTASIYFALFLATSYGLDTLEGYFSEMGGQVLSNELLLSLINIILFGLLGSALSVAFHLPDILDSIKDFFTTAWDGIRLMRAPRHVAYFRGKDVNHEL